MANVIKVACKFCGQQINIPAPQQPGLYAITCPHCQGQMKVKYNPKPITLATPTQPISNPMPASMPTPAPANNAANSAQHNPTRRFDMSGMPSFSAPIHSPQPQQQQAATGDAGRLSMVRLGCDKEYFPLHMGENIVGRKDLSQPSDVAIDGDMTMSRRSVKITVSAGAGGCTYMLTVLKTVNPVQVNGAPIGVGQTVPLTIGASIFMGQTMLRLEK